MIKKFRHLLYPISFLYNGVIAFRNFLFDKNILKSASFNFPIICVGNLALGGTGKTPMTEYLIEILKAKYKIATLSRGYKRKTKGFAIADARTTALEIGDEPMQFHQKYPEVVVAVGEERLEAIPQILHNKSETEVIILDDAFQHRTVRAGLNILLTECDQLYTRDLILPVGNLRDVKSSAKRANVIVVTKCRPDLSLEEKRDIQNSIKPLIEQNIFFTEIVYNIPYHLFKKDTLNIGSSTDALVITGIANPAPLQNFVAKNLQSHHMLTYPDHHIFSSTDLNEIKKQFDKIKSTNKVILTTEKDAVRLQKFVSELADLPLYVLPIKHKFLFDEASDFNNIVLDFVDLYAKNNDTQRGIF